jgi:hypothetical protein
MTSEERVNVPNSYKEDFEYLEAKINVLAFSIALIGVSCIYLVIRNKLK